MLEFKCHAVSETAVLVHITDTNGNIIPKSEQEKRLSLIAVCVRQLLVDAFTHQSSQQAQLLQQKNVESVSAFDSVLLDFSNTKISIEKYLKHCEDVLDFSKYRLQEKYLGKTIDSNNKKVIHIPVQYDTCDNYDLNYVAKTLKLSTKEVIHLHNSRRYHVFCLGFIPGFAFLGSLKPELKLPRRKTPRTKVPKGAVAIANSYTAVYPEKSPGGWHIIGTTDKDMMSIVDGEPKYLLAPGDEVVFIAA